MGERLPYVKLANSELGFDAGYAVVDIYDLAGKGVEFDLQVIESSIQPCLKAADAGLHPAHPGIHSTETGVQTAVLDGVHQHSHQDGEGWNADSQIKLQAGHLKNYCTSGS